MNLRHHAVLPLLFLAATLLSAGCNSKRDMRMRMDPDFSVNVVEVPPDFPLEEKDWPEDPRLAMLQQQAYARYGPPDYFHLRWRKDGQILTRAELFAKSWVKRERDAGEYAKEQNTEIEWVYLSPGQIIRFDKRNTEPEVRDLDDLTRTITQYGDPEEIKRSRDLEGPNIIFSYYTAGKIFYFRENGKQYRDENIPAQPAYIMRD